MGCGIHAVIEIRYSNSGDWEAKTEPNINRWYELFGRLAQVRKPEVGKYPPKGKVSDPSFRTERLFEEWDGDLHSHSWLTLKEIAKDFECSDLEAIIAYMDAFEKNDYKTRLVFAFDN